MKVKVCISLTNSKLLNHQHEVVVLRTKAARLADSVMLLPAASKETLEENNAAQFSDEIA